MLTAISLNHACGHVSGAAGAEGDQIQPDNLQQLTEIGIYDYSLLSARHPTQAG